MSALAGDLAVVLVRLLDERLDAALERDRQRQAATGGAAAGLLSLGDAARMLALESTSSVTKLVEQGEVQALKVLAKTAVTRASVEAYIERQTGAARAQRDRARRAAHRRMRSVS